MVTILLAVAGNLKVPNIRSREDLRAVLNKLGSVPCEQVFLLFWRCCVSFSLQSPMCTHRNITTKLLLCLSSK